MEHSAALIQTKPLLLVVALCSEYRLGGGVLGNGRLMVVSTLVRAVKPPLLFYRLGGAPCSDSVPRSASLPTLTGTHSTGPRLWSETQLWITAHKKCCKSWAGAHRQIWQEPCGRLVSCLMCECVCGQLELQLWALWCTEKPAACLSLLQLCVSKRSVVTSLCLEDYPSDLCLFALF